ncbi:NACHT, LRR and PYD domains-containing protein 12-like [Salarias fasciatus]|uniref:NACHT, LRR and PYD domains-containing protein 12-like n=1 Tax=Salarias fasciatus TaxID=181472 RepID=UPI00117655B3|nr:NACHT, LRR and PYD domains-containing protein 12-like [Salarias fasciatus]
MDRENIMKEVKHRLKSHLRYKFTWINEGTSDGHSRLDHVYTRLYITDQASGFDFRSHEILDHFKVSGQTGQLTGVYERIDCLNIFKAGRKSFQLPVRDRPIRTVMTKGIAGIGKTFAVQFFALNWAEGKSNQDIDLIFMLPFRELNMLKQGEYSLMQLLLHFYPQLSPLENTSYLTSMNILIILDGLDENTFPLDFDGGGRVSDIDQKSTVDVLLSSLITGNLLPNVRLWITSRPTAVGQVPVHYVDQMTEVQGFTDHDKDIYFQKRFSDSTEVLSYLKGMVSFYFMGHIPIFCWILAEVVKNGDETSQTIRTMTELYIHYLLIQTQRSQQKYGETDSKNEAKEGLARSQNANMLLNLSRLAFEQLQKGNILFYEKDLQECGIDADEASVFCGFCSEILKQERGLYQQKMFSFVHLSFQEFLAALHVIHCRATDRSTLTSFLGEDVADLSWLELQKKVVDKALQNEKGQLDLFLCFFLGLSLESNQTMLQALLPETESSTDTSEDMKMYLRSFHTGNIPAERCMNLLLCKFELKEERFQEEVPKYLHAGATLSTVDCAVLSTMLQLSGEVIEELNLTNCFIPSAGVPKLLLNVKSSKKALLKDRYLYFGDLAFISTLQSADSHLRDLSVEYFSDSGMDHHHKLFAVLRSPDCKLEKLRLTGLSLNFQSCHALFSILQSKQSPLRVLDLNNCRYIYHTAHTECNLYQEPKTMESCEDIDDELTLLTLIPAALIGPVCKLEEFRMPGCCLRSRCCQVFASALCSDSQLKELDLSRNPLQDLGAQLLSAGLGSSKCKLQILRLSNCGITEEGCTSLASALKSNPSHLRELDLSYNYPGDLGVRLLSERLQNPECSLERLNVDHNEEHWVNPQLLTQFTCDLSLDPNTLHESLILSDCGRTVSRSKEKQPYPDHPDRFSTYPQLLCRETLTGRCYWEVEWSMFAIVGVAYKSLPRKGPLDSNIEHSDKSWCHIRTSAEGSYFRHNYKETFIPASPGAIKVFRSRVRRLGLFLDWPAGTLSVYHLSGETKTLIHTFHTTFTEPLFPAFIVYAGTLALSSVGTPNMHKVHTSFTPEVKRERIGLSYSFRFPGPGLFHCSLTDLVFSVTHESEATYEMRIWDEMQLQLAQKVPGGALFSITCPEESIRQLHLPHCEPEPALLSDCLSVAHITDEGMSFIQSLEVTETHVVVDVPHLSALGIVWDPVFADFMTKPIRSQVLLFLKPMHRQGFILWVILLPSNVPLNEVKAQLVDCEHLQAPSFCLLHTGQYYSLCSEPQDFNIQPACTEFFGNYGPNYHPTFEMAMLSKADKVTLMLRDAEKTQVWEHQLHLPAMPEPTTASRNQPRLASDIPAREKLFRVRSSFVEQVSDPVLNKLLDELLHCGVLTDSENEVLRAKLRPDKARELIDTARKKGADASTKLIAVLAAADPYCCRELGLC